MMGVFFLLLILLEPNFFQKYEVANNYFEKGNWIESSRLFYELYKHYRDSDYSNELYYRWLESEFNQGHYHLTLKKSRKFLKKVKGTYLEPEVYYLIGLSSAMIGDTIQLKENILRLKKFPTHVNSNERYLLEGLYHYLKKDWDGVIVSLKEIKDPYALMLYSNACSRKNLTIEALKSLYMANSLIENNDILKSLIKFNIFHLFVTKELYDVASKKGMEWLKNYENSPLRPYVMLITGYSLYKLRQFENAIRYLKEVPKRDVSQLNPIADYFYGDCEYNLKDYDQALILFEKTESYWGNSVFPILSALRKAQISYVKGDTNSTLSYINEAVSFFISHGQQNTGYWVSAVYNYLTGHYKDAAKNCELILESDTDQWKSHSLALLLASYLKLKKPEVAISLAKIYMRKINKDTVWKGFGLYYLARAYEQVGALNEARKLYNEIFTKYNQIPSLYVYTKLAIGWNFIRSNMDSTAISIFDEILNVDLPDTNLIILAYLGKGIATFNTGNYLEAYKLFTYVSSNYSHKKDLMPYVLYYRGYSTYALKYYGNSVETWRQLIRDYGYSELSARGAFMLGNLFMKAGKYSEAIKYFNWLKNNHPNSNLVPEAVYKIGLAYFDLEEYKKAIATLETFKTLYPNHPLANKVDKTIEQIYYTASEKDTTIYEEFKRSYPSSELAANLMYNKAVDLFTKGDSLKAARTFERMAIEFPTSKKAPEALFNAAQLYALLGKWEKASAAYEKLIRFYNKDRDKALFGLSTAYIELKKFHKAISILDTIILKYPESEYYPKALKNIGICYVKIGNYEKAVKAFVDLGNYYENNGRIKDAVTIYEYALQITTDSSVKEYLSSKIKVLKGG